jgi:hypothetical protein
MFGTSKRSPAVPIANFYARAIDAATEMADAAALENVDAELALLRTRLRRHLLEYPGDLELMFKGVMLIVRTAQARYRMSPRQAQDLAESATDALRRLQESVFGERDDDNDV